MRNNEAAYCIEYFHAKPEHLQDLMTALQKLVDQTRAEQGCLQYDLLQDKQNSNLLIIVMKFTTENAIKIHEQQPYIKEFAELLMPKYCEKVVWHDAKTLSHIF